MTRDRVESTSLEEPRELTRPAHRHTWRWIVFIAIVVIILIVAVEAIALLGARADLTDGRDALQSAKRAALAGDLEQAGTSFDRAQGSFASAADGLHAPIGTAARAVPWVGNSADAAAAMADAGQLLAAAGAGLVDGLERLPDGVSSLAPHAGVLPLGRYAALAGAIDAAHDDAAEAAATLADAPDSFMPRVIASARWDAQAQTDRLSADLGGVASLLHGAPAFGGADGPRRYLVLAQNPAELRGTGGLWGAYAILTLDHGRATVSGAKPTKTLQDFPADKVPAPSQDYATNYDQYGGAGSWQNMNATPDMPSAAQAALANYRLGEGRRLDGVFAVDPFALEELLAVTGPINVPGVGSITADNVVDVTTNRAYTNFPNAVRRKDVLGDAAATVFARFLGMDGHGIAPLRAISTAVADGHLRIYSADPTVESGLTVLGVDGALTDPGGDVMGVTVNNGSGSKVDYYAARTVDYDVQLGGDGEAIGTANVTIANDAPTHGEPRYVIGPYVHGAHAGDNIPLTTVWCHASCELESATSDGEHQIGLAAGSENGVPWLRDYRTIPAGHTGTLSLVWRSSGVWEGNSSGGSYELTLLGQPTIRPTDVTATIHAPAGTDIVWTSTPMAVDGGTATWHGAPSSTTTLEVRFQAPLPLRLVRDVTRPVFG
jgi:hypothetical protein